MLQIIRKGKRFNNIYLLTLCGFMLMFMGCATREQGCLDIYAENFALTAEKACDDCCLYPALNVSLSQKWGTRNFSVTDTLFDLQGQPYQITDIKYFLSNWILDGVDDNKYRVDSALLSCVPPIQYGPDILLIDAQQFVYEVGIIRTAPTIDSICTTLGLTTTYSCIAADTTGQYTNLTSASPLWNPGTDALSTIRLVVRPDLHTEGLDTLYFDLTQRDSIAFPLDFIIGSHTTLKLTVDYAMWFGQVAVADAASFRSSIAAGFKGSIYATPK